MRKPALTFRHSCGKTLFGPLCTSDLFGGGDATAAEGPVSLRFGFPTLLLPLLFGSNRKRSFDFVRRLRAELLLQFRDSPLGLVELSLGFAQQSLLHLNQVDEPIESNSPGLHIVLELLDIHAPDIHKSRKSRYADFAEWTATLKDGSYLAKLYPSARHRDRDEGGIEVRIIEYTFDDPGRPGSGEKHRLLTTLLDEDEHPADCLIMLYHERWEEEVTIDELKTHQRERTVLRSETPAGVVQEIYGLLLGHYVVRKVMCEAAVVAECEPRDLSFVNTLKILRCRLPEVPRSPVGIQSWYQNLIAEVAEERLEPRRDRINPRVIKRKMSNWAKKRQKHWKFPQPTRTFHESIVLLN
jgi:hypothetical protein